MIFENARVITVDETRRVIEDGAVAVDGDRIAAVGKRAEVEGNFPDYQRYDAKGGIILPGLVDCHVHMSQALIRGSAENTALVEWLKRVWRCQGNFTEEDGKLSAELCILEMIKSGTTAFVETMISSRYGFNGMAQAVVDSGIRAALSKTIMDNPGFGGEESIMYPGQAEEKNATLAEAVAMHEKWEGAADGRIQVWFGPRPIGTGTSVETMKEIIKLARRHDMPIDIHCCECKSETIYYKREFAGYTPGRLTGWLEDIGLLGPKTLLIHVNWLELEDIPILASTGTHVVHNPYLLNK
ncbi:MAG: amidohydrolase family protein [Candidatus Auribacterota bacterium]|nr:amidohydrolase family protein [Candidatus Auribacterota bacterium]